MTFLARVLSLDESPLRSSVRLLPLELGRVFCCVATALLVDVLETEAARISSSDSSSLKYNHEISVHVLYSKPLTPPFGFFTHGISPRNSSCTWVRYDSIASLSGTSDCAIS